MCICYIHTWTSSDRDAPISVSTMSKQCARVFKLARFFDKGLDPQACYLLVSRVRPFTNREGMKESGQHCFNLPKIWWRACANVTIRHGSQTDFFRACTCAEISLVIIYNRKMVQGVHQPKGEGLGTRPGTCRSCTGKISDTF